MRCTNCDAEIPRGATSCPSCGVYAFDEPPAPPAPPRRVWWPLVLVAGIVLAGAGGWWWWSTTTAESRRPKAVAKPEPVHVVRDRPGGNVQEAEAIRALRRHLTIRGIPSECVVVMSNGLHAGAYQLTAYDHCKKINLGPWSVDAKTHEVKMR
jgi:hypothetical protein